MEYIDELMKLLLFFYAISFLVSLAVESLKGALRL